MRSIFLVLILGLTHLLAEVITLVPYGGYTTYDSDSSKSIKESGVFGGLYTNVGTLSYLLELNYMYMNTVYKEDVDLIDLVQHDITLAYSSYSTNFMYKIGAHYTETNDLILGNGIVAILSFGGYNYFGYDKVSYGLDGYYSYYADRINYTNTNTNMGIGQLTPYLSYYNVLKLGVANTISFKLNYQYAGNYSQKEYISYELSDTLIYNKIKINLSAYTGEMKSGVKEGGLSVYNSLDLMQDGISLSLGYYVTPSFITSISYNYSFYEEAFLDKPTSTDTFSANLNYRF